MALMELPVELLIQILEEVGGSHLRRGKGVDRLALCRKWYVAARPIYLSGLGTTNISVYGSNLKELDNKYGHSGLRPLMYKNTRKLHVRLLGHYWDENSAQIGSNDDENGYGASYTAVRNVAPFDFGTPEVRRTLECWRDEELKPRLDEVFSDLNNFSTLEHFTFEASSDSGGQFEDGPHWSYLYTNTITRLLTNLPILHDLSNFTMDICGLDPSFLDDENSPSAHICHPLSDIIPRIETVRIRTPQICPHIYRVGRMDAREVKLKSLTIKLHLPNFSNSAGPWVKACQGLKERFNRKHIYQHMALGAYVYLDCLARLRTPEMAPAARSHGMTGFRISFVYRLLAPRVIVLDCLTKRTLWPAEEFLWFQDDGTPSWFEFANEEDMLDNGLFK